MNKIKLPPSLSPVADEGLGESRQITVIGANGAGKSRFMEEMTTLCGERAYCLSALSAFYPERHESTMPGSIDAQYRQAVRQQSYMRTDAVSELDKILYMLFADELESLLELKQNARGDSRKLRIETTRLDIIKQHWESVFPGNRITREKGMLRFATSSGGDLITAGSLSQGEKAALYYMGATLYAPRDAVIFIDSPTLFVHPSILGSLWNTIEELRPDCTFVYNSVDEDFVSTRTHNTCVWVKRYDSGRKAWDYEIVNGGNLSDELMVEFAGSRRSVLFIEGDGLHSIDSKLYPLVFRDYTVQSLGSCNKVIEATRTFNDLNSFHNMVSVGIVDRDRRDAHEVDYLRRKNVMVPEVAEVENILMLEEVIMAVAARHNRDGQRAVARVKKAIINQFAADLKQQALQHTRHRVKRTVEYRIDGRFTSINTLEKHVQDLWQEVNPRGLYEDLCREFRSYVAAGDYAGVLRVYNQKSMLSTSNVAQLCGLQTKEQYIASVIKILRNEEKGAAEIRSAIMKCFNLEPQK